MRKGECIIPGLTTKTCNSKNNIKAQTLVRWTPGEILKVHHPCRKVSTGIPKQYETSLCSSCSREPSDLLFKSDIEYPNRNFRFVMFIGIHFFNFLAQGYVTSKINFFYQGKNTRTHTHWISTLKYNWYWNRSMYFHSKQPNTTSNLRILSPSTQRARLICYLPSITIIDFIIQINNYKYKQSEKSTSNGNWTTHLMLTYCLAPRSGLVV